MATKAATAQVQANDNVEEPADGPLMDGVAQEVKKLLAKGKERGYITIDELNAILPQDQVSSEQIEDTMTMLSEMGINVVDGEETDDTPATTGEAPAATGNLADDDIGRTDDPVRMYLREMGSVELLSREGEIAIAKRIEAGREKMIGALCESPLTMQAITHWHDALVEGRMLLRDVIDLDATFGGTPDGANGTGESAVEEMAEEDELEDEDTEEDEDGGDSDEDDEEEESSMSLAAMEQALKPDILEKFEKISSTYIKLHRAQDKRLVALQKGEAVSKSTERTYERHRKELLETMELIRLNNAKIEQLVHQLYAYSKKLTGREGRLMRLSVNCGVKREDFSLGAGRIEIDPGSIRLRVPLSGSAMLLTM